MSVSLEQRIRFCTSGDGVRIAAATTGTGPPLVKAANWLNHLEFDNRSPVWRHWIRELSRDHTLVRYDERGCGLSEWDVEDFSLDAWVQDLETVVDDLELERFALLGISQGGPIAVAYAALHPERVSRLILYGSYARGRSHRNLSEREHEEGELMRKMIEVGWGTDHAAFRQVFTSMFIPEASAEQSHWFNELERVSATPQNAARILSACHALDVRALAPRLTTPSLVLHVTQDLRVPFDEGRLLASLIPDARFVTLEGRNHLLLEGEPAWPRFLREVREFLGVEASASEVISAQPPSLPDAALRSRVEAVFDEAVELVPAERPAFLERACAGDRRLRDEVEMMLQLAERSDLTARLAGAMARAGAGAAARAQQSAVSPGRRLSQYEILEPLGGGGMGVVYKALDRRLQRPVALKLLPPYLSGEQELKVRFLQEAEAIASLDHANICAVLEVEELDGGQLFMVMPFYEGETLKQKIARGPIEIARALDYASQIAAGLAHAHAAGIVHRDIKPANVIVAPDERVRILDFGVAKLSHRNLTQTGAVLGTLSYMSPEQACGDPVDQRTDLWALGAVLYEMLAGTPPFSAASPEALYFAIQYRDPISVTSFRPDIPPALAAIVHRLLEKDTGRRYADAREVLAELERAGTDKTAVPDEEPGASPQSRSTGSTRAAAHLVGRGAEVEQLRTLLREVCRGSRRVAFIAGEPGIGKSTLVEMFLDRVRGRQVRIGRGQCLEQHGAREPYLPVLDALGRLCREHGGAGLIAVLERYAPTWLAQMPSLLDAQRLETVQGRAVGATRARMLREIVEALDAFAVDVPLLLILEDLHLSDPSTLDLLAAVAQGPEPAQLLVLCTYRPGDASDGLTELLGTLRSQGPCTMIALRAWSDAATRP